MTRLQPVVLGVDPGAAFTGIAARRGDELLGARVLTRSRLLDPITSADHVRGRKAWTQIVMGTVGESLAALAATHHLGEPWSAIAEGTLVLGVEDVVRPNRHAGRQRGAADGIADVGPLLETAITIGRLLAGWPDLTFVRPQRNGQAADRAYPAEIRSGVRGLGGPTEHARSAWDVAGAAVQLDRHLRLMGDRP